jgi:hypothetical protein
MLLLVFADAAAAAAICSAVGAQATTTEQPQATASNQSQRAGRAEPAKPFFLDAFFSSFCCIMLCAKRRIHVCATSSK